MAEVVPTNGFDTGIPPQDLKPGFVAPPKPTEPAPTDPAPKDPAPAAADASLQSAIAALTAALAGAAPASPAPATESGVVNPDLNTDPGNLNEFNPAELDDPILRSMASVMKTVGRGIDLDRAMGRAIVEGRADLIDVAYLREAGKANADDLITLAQGIVEAVAAKAVNTSAKVHSLAGGQDNWNAGVAVFNKGAPQELKLVVAQMLDSGKDNLIEAGAKIVVEFSKSTLPSKGNPITASAGNPAGQALSKEGFQEELRKLNPQARDFASKREELFNRRALGRKLGL